MASVLRDNDELSVVLTTKKTTKAAKAAAKAPSAAAAPARHAGAAAQKAATKAAKQERQEELVRLFPPSLRSLGPLEQCTAAHGAGGLGSGLKRMAAAKKVEESLSEPVAATAPRAV